MRLGLLLLRMRGGHAAAAGGVPDSSAVSGHTACLQTTVCLRLSSMYCCAAIAPRDRLWLVQLWGVSKGNRAVF